MVLHLSADYPDPLVPHKPAVIARLLELTAGRFSHRVLSLNRVAPTPGSLLGGDIVAAERPFDGGSAIAYRAPPLGLFHAAMLGRLGGWLAERAATANAALLVGHKLGVEGLAVARAAQRLGLPYALTLQGKTDLRVLAARPDLRRLLARVFHGAATVVAFAPWTLDAIERRLGARSGAKAVIPCPVQFDTPMPPVCGAEGLVSVFHLRHWRNKNLAGLAAASRLLDEAGEPIRLGIVGGGDARAWRQCRRAVARAPSLTLEGPIEAEALRLRLNRARGLVLASHRESFGLVLIEALLAGTPVIYPCGAAIDGLFPAAPFAIAVDSGDRTALAAAMRRLVAEERHLKALLGAWQGSADAARFSRARIGAAYADSLEAALAGQG